MNKRLIPTYFENSFYDLCFENIQNKGYLYLFVDLDNTLASPYVYDPDINTINHINKLKNMGFIIIVISNNHEDRVKRFTKNLNINYLFEYKKSNKDKINKYIIDNNIDKSKCLFIGDQVMTDVNVANKIGVDSCLLNPLTRQDEPITFFPRLLDKFYKKKILKHKLAGRINNG